MKLSAHISPHFLYLEKWTRGRDFELERLRDERDEYMGWFKCSTAKVKFTICVDNCIDSSSAFPWYAYTGTDETERYARLCSECCTASVPLGLMTGRHQ
jgi:hypothetical protein